MRGDDEHQDAMFSYISPEARVPHDHPLRIIRRLVDTILVELSPEFDALYARTGRPSVPPEKLLRALGDWLTYDRPKKALPLSTWSPLPILLDLRPP